MKFKTKSLVTLMLAFVMILSMTTANAAKSFPDVIKTGQHGWAYEYIMEMAEKGIINGYEDGYFRPQNTVTYLETLRLIEGIINPSTSETNQALSTYANQIKDAGVPEWAKSCVAIALARNVITENELKAAAKHDMLKIGTDKKIDRLTISVYIARALELKPKSVAVLKYKDADKINKDYINLIAALIDTKVLHPEGRDGNFDGDKPVKRSEIAKMVKISYDWVKQNPLSGTQSGTSQKGLVKAVETIQGKDYIIYEVSGTKKSAIITTNTKIYAKDGSAVNKSSLASGQDIEINVSASAGNSIVNQIKILSDITNYNGEIIDINTVYNKIVVRYDDNGIKRDKTFTLTPSATIIRDGKPAYFSELRVGDKVKVDTSKSTLDRIEASSKADGQYTFISYNAAGATGYAPDYYRVVLRANTQGSVNDDHYAIKDVLVINNGTRYYGDSGLRTIKNGDQVNITNNSSNYIEKIEVVSGNQEVREYLRHGYNRLIVQGALVTEDSLAMDSNVEVYKNGVRINLSDLRKGNKIRLTRKDDREKTVVKIEVVEDYNSDIYEVESIVEPTVTYSGRIYVKDVNYGGSKNFEFYNNYPTVLDSQGRTISLKDIRSGTRVKLSFNYDGKVIQVNVLDGYGYQGNYFNYKIKNNYIEIWDSVGRKSTREARYVDFYLNNERTSHYYIPSEGVGKPTFDSFDLLTEFRIYTNYTREIYGKVTSIHRESSDSTAYQVRVEYYDGGYNQYIYHTVYSNNGCPFSINDNVRVLFNDNGIVRDIVRY
ncbi:MAG: S-layer homology domain-containing protein [Tissierellia bacterium]|nr:S-layer homology domain-containing protein [Tissierellia bacterium]